MGVFQPVFRTFFSEHLRLGFASITEATANVESITEMVCESFSNTNLALVQSNCLRYEDSEGTRGETF